MQAVQNPIFTLLANSFFPILSFRWNVDGTPKLPFPLYGTGNMLPVTSNLIIITIPMIVILMVRDSFFNRGDSRK